MFAWLGHFPAGLPEVLVPDIFGEEGAERRAILLRRGLAEEVGREQAAVLPAPVRAYARGRAVELAAGAAGGADGGELWGDGGVDGCALPAAG